MPLCLSTPHQGLPAECRVWSMKPTPQSRHVCSLRVLRRHHDRIRSMVRGPTSAAPLHHATCTPTNIAPASPAFWPTVNGRNGTTNSENHNTPESSINTIPARAAVRLRTRPPTGESSVICALAQHIPSMRQAGCRTLQTASAGRQHRFRPMHSLHERVVHFLQHGLVSRHRTWGTYGRANLPVWRVPTSPDHAL